MQHNNSTRVSKIQWLYEEEQFDELIANLQQDSKEYQQMIKENNLDQNQIQQQGHQQDKKYYHQGVQDIQQLNYDIQNRELLNICQEQTTYINGMMGTIRELQQNLLQERQKLEKAQKQINQYEQFKQMYNLQDQFKKAPIIQNIKLRPLHRDLVFLNNTGSNKQQQEEEDCIVIDN